MRSDEFTAREVAGTVESIIANVQEENGVLLGDMTAAELRALVARVLDFTATI